MLLAPTVYIGHFRFLLSRHASQLKRNLHLYIQLYATYSSSRLERRRLDRIFFDLDRCRPYSTFWVSGEESVRFEYKNP